MFNRKNDQLNKNTFLNEYWWRPNPPYWMRSPFWQVSRMMGKHLIEAKRKETLKMANENWRLFQACSKNAGDNYAQKKNALSAVIVSLDQVKAKTPKLRQRLQAAIDLYAALKKQKSLQINQADQIDYLETIHLMEGDIAGLEDKVIQGNKLRQDVSDIYYEIAIKNEEISKFHQLLGVPKLERLSLLLALDYLKLSGVQDRSDGLYDDIVESLKAVSHLHVDAAFTMISPSTG